MKTTANTHMHANDAVARAARNLLEERAQNMDADTRRRLAAARRSALQARREPRSWLPGPPLAWGGGLAMAASLAVVLFSGVWQQPVEPAVADLELLTADEQLEFYEDLEFAAWLAEESVPDQSMRAGNVDAG